MRTLLTALVLAASTVSVLPSASAAPPCDPVLHVEPGTYVTSCGEVWQECNGIAGLQDGSGGYPPDCKLFPPGVAPTCRFYATAGANGETYYVDSCGRVWRECNGEAELQPDDCRVEAPGCDTIDVGGVFYVYGCTEIWYECNGMSGLQRGGYFPDCRFPPPL